MSTLKLLKGEYNGLCYRTSCSNENARYFNHSTRQHYCTQCAEVLNSDPHNERDSKRLYGHDLCTLVDEKCMPDNFDRFTSEAEITSKQKSSISPTQKPVKLLEEIIKTYTNEGCLVLDNCSGSGTTAVACINTNRKYICIEKDKQYFDKSIIRINNLTPKP